MKNGFYVTRTDADGITKTMTQGGAWKINPGDRTMLYSDINCRETIRKALMDTDRGAGVNTNAFVYEVHDRDTVNA